MKPAITMGTMVLALGCGGSTSAGSGDNPPGQATVSGTVPTMPPHYSATAYAWALYGGGSHGTQTTIVLDNLVGASDICGLVNSNMTPASSREFLLVLHAPTETVAPGRYSVGDALQADYMDTDGNCMFGPETSATGGTAELVRTGTSYEGSFDVTFPAGRMQGTFNAPTCDSPAGSMMSDAGMMCVQYAACASQPSGGPCMD